MADLLILRKSSCTRTSSMRSPDRDLEEACQCRAAVLTALAMEESNYSSTLMLSLPITLTIHRKHTHITPQLPSHINSLEVVSTTVLRPQFSPGLLMIAAAISSNSNSSSSNTTLVIFPCPLFLVPLREDQTTPCSTRMLHIRNHRSKRLLEVIVDMQLVLNIPTVED